MLLLRDFGLPANNRQAQTACTLLFDGGLRQDGGINYGTRGPSETCITGMVLSILSHFEYEDDRLDIMADHLLEQQMPDGGWICRRRRGATHASVHTTISALEGSPRPSRSSVKAETRTAAGRCNTCTGAKRTSRWNAAAGPAAGTRCARYGC
jgi:hypothetical protein